MTKVIITGAASGIGNHLANRFAENGYTVIAADISPASFTNPAIHFYHLDLRDETSVNNFFEQIKETFGSAEILINNGAVSNFHKPVTDISITEFDNVIATNLRGAFICCKHFITLNKSADFGRIINIASTRFHQNEADWEAYGASKGGLISLTNTLCVSLANTQITVNAVSPGWIQTENYESLSESDHKQHPSGRVGKPEDIFKACLYLCDKDNDFINGANIIIDGGMTKKMIYV